ncbi:ATP-NAD kinase family protein [[Eubacterium] cellulosolvens]
MKIGFLINPIAGMGGRVGLKGTDGVLDQAIERGAIPIAQTRAKEAIDRYVKLMSNQVKPSAGDEVNIEWVTCMGLMGQDALKEAGLEKLANHRIKIVYEPPNPNHTTAEDTISACQAFITEGVELIVFCGGDGTARDVFSVVNAQVPLLGIPSGVKMHSGVFATHTNYAGDLLVDYLRGEMDTAEGEILDLDEDKYRNGEWNIRLFGIAKTPYEPTIIQRGKHMVESASDAEIKEEIADFIQEEMEENLDTLYIMGSGSTVQAIAKHLGIENSLLGIDAVYQKKLVGKDLNERSILELLNKYPKVRLILSPIGAQGFILGRGNLQLSPAVIRKIGLENIDVVSTPAKLNDLEALKVDTGDIELDQAFVIKGYISVKIGYRQMKLKKLAI